MELVLPETDAEREAEKALFKRLKKHLANDNFDLKRAKTWSYDTGWYYAVDNDTNFIAASYNSLEELAKIEGIA